MTETTEKFIDGILFNVTTKDGKVVDVELTEEGRKDIIFDENMKIDDNIS